MKFVTSAYKKKLVEQRKWELQQRLEDEKEQRQDVTNKGMDGYVFDVGHPWRRNRRLPIRLLCPGYFCF